MKSIIFSICIILLGASFCFAQGGIYSIIDSKGISLNKFGESTLEEVLGDAIKDISIIEYNGGWKDKDEAKTQLIKILHTKEIKASSTPLWNMDIPVELVGIINYVDGSEGKIAVAQHRVGFQDKMGKPWYFQWEDRIPWKR